MPPKKAAFGGIRTLRGGRPGPFAASHFHVPTLKGSNVSSVTPQ